jgi:c-di-GMP-binding flagellar brake protein YcgR
VSRAVAVDLPRVNTPLVLTLPDVDGDVRSRLEDTWDAVLVVAAVVVPGRVGVRRAGSTMTVRWAVPPRGVLEVPCTLVESLPQQPPLWVLRPAGPPRRVQRRRYVRADVLARAELEPWVDGDEPAELPWRAVGTVQDLCEGGVRVVVTADPGAPVTVGSALRLTVALPARPVSARAHVVAVEPLPDRRLQLRLWFELSERDAEVVRREVLRRQTESRGREVP